MKRFALVLCALILAVCLFGCNNSEDAIDYSTDKSWADIPQYSSEYPTAEDIADAYNAAYNAFGWVALTSVPPLDADDTYVVQNIPYYRVDVPYLLSLSDLELYYGTLFDKETVQMIMEVNEEIGRFVENPDGGLYCMNFKYTPEGYSDEEVFTVSRNSDTSYTYTVTYYTLDAEGNKGDEYKQGFNFDKIDGRWVFVDFYNYKV